jgi:hypothetical protein
VYFVQLSDFGLIYGPSPVTRKLCCLLFFRAPFKNSAGSKGKNRTRITEQLEQVVQSSTGLVLKRITGKFKAGGTVTRAEQCVTGAEHKTEITEQVTGARTEQTVEVQGAEPGAEQV